MHLIFLISFGKQCYTGMLNVKRRLPNAVLSVIVTQYTKLDIAVQIFSRCGELAVDLN